MHFAQWLIFAAMIRLFASVLCSNKYLHLRLFLRLQKCILKWYTSVATILYLHMHTITLQQQLFAASFSCLYLQTCTLWWQLFVVRSVKLQFCVYIYKHTLSATVLCLYLQTYTLSYSSIFTSRNIPFHLRFCVYICKHGCTLHSDKYLQLRFFRLHLHFAATNIGIYDSVCDSKNAFWSDTYLQLQSCICIRKQSPRNGKYFQLRFHIYICKHARCCDNSL